MKRIVLLSILLVSIFQLRAQQDMGRRGEGRAERRMADASLRIKLTTDQLVSISVDDRYYERRTRSITVGNIPAGRHYLKVYNFRETRGGNGRANLVYSGYVDLKPNSFNAAVVDPLRKKMTMRTTQSFDRNTPNDYYESWNDRRDDNQWNDRDRDRDRWNDNVLRNQDVTDLNLRVKDRITDGDKVKLMQQVLTSRSYYTDQLRTMMGWLSFESSKLDFAKWAYDNALDKENYWKLEDLFSFSSSKDELTSYVQSRGGMNNNNNNNWGGNRGRDNAMRDQDVSDLGARVKDRITDSDKLKLIQTVLNGKEYYTDQVRTMMGWLSFESTRLELAKYAYNATIDRENYWKLEDMLSFSSSKNELSEYVNR
ncbi:MAG: DUF4476 domain-containing protein [Flavipsychrobacter sp.]|nr:DUF4476 domain-containing protein [Flavipsychrobacter sp.]